MEQIKEQLKELEISFEDFERYVNEKQIIKEKENKILQLEKDREDLLKVFLEKSREIQNEEKILRKERENMDKIHEKIFGNVSEMSYEEGVIEKEMKKRREKKKELQKEIMKLKEYRSEKLIRLKEVLEPSFGTMSELTKETQKEIDDLTLRIEIMYGQITLIYIK